MITDDEAQRLLSNKTKMVSGIRYHAILDDVRPEGHTRIHLGSHSRLVGYRYIATTECNHMLVDLEIERRRRKCDVCKHSKPHRANVIDRRCQKCERKCLILVLTAKPDSQCPEKHW